MPNLAKMLKGDSPIPRQPAQNRTRRWYEALVSPDGAGILALIAVALLDLGSYPPGDSRRWMALGLHLLFLVLFLGSERMAWQRPLMSHLLLGVLSAITVVLGWMGGQGTTLVVLFFVLSAYAQEMLPERPGYLWIGVFAVATVAVFTYYLSDLSVGLLVGIGALGGYLFIGSASRNRRLAEGARTESQRLLHELQAAHEQLQHYAREAESLAAAEERNRLARELHDTLGHRLTVAAVQLEGAQRLIGRDGAKAETMVAAVRGQVLEGLAELRQTVAALRVPLEADLALPAALERLAGHYAVATGLAVHLEIDPRVEPYLARLSLIARHTLYRAAQEGLTNVQKHAGADAIWLTVEPVAEADGAPAQVRLTIHDNGRGANATDNTDNTDSAGSRGFGLNGLRERAAQVGGELALQPSPHGGLALSVTVPLSSVEPAALHPKPPAPETTPASSLPRS